MRNLFFILAILLMVVGCRGGHFDQRPMAKEQILFRAAFVSSSQHGPCDDTDHCFQIETAFEIRDSLGEPMASTNIRVETQHPKIFSRDLGTLKTDGLGILRFTVRMQEFPTEAGKTFFIGIRFLIEGKGEKFFCAEAQPSSPTNPIHSVRECNATEFMPSESRLKLNYEASVIDSSLLEVKPLEAPFREALIQMDFAINNASYEQRQLADLEVKWKLLYGNSEAKGVARTDTQGRLSIRYTVKFSSVENERQRLFVYQMQVVDGPANTISGYYYLNLGQSQSKPLVGSGRGQPPSFTATRDFSQALVLQPLSLEPSIEESHFVLDQAARLTFSKKYLFQFSVQLTRQLLTGQTVPTNLYQHKLQGKIFFLQNDTLLEENIVDGLLDGNSSMTVILNPVFVDFSKPSKNLRIVLAFFLPQIPEVEGSFYEVIPHHTGGFRARPMPKESIKNSYPSLVERILDLSESIAIETPHPLTPAEAIENSIDLSTTVPNSNREPLQRALLDRWDTILKEPSIEDLKPLYRFLTSTPENQDLKAEDLAQRLIVREYLVNVSIESQNLANPDAALNEASRIRPQIQMLPIRMDVKGKAIRCLAFEYRKAISQPYSKAHFCKKDPEIFQNQFTWYFIERIQDAIETFEEELGRSYDAVLLQDPPKKEAIWTQMKEDDLFKNPKRQAYGSLRRTIFPRN